MYAAENGAEEIVRKLIEEGANVNQVDKDGKTALMYAAENGAEEIVRKLIESVDNVNQVDKNDTKSLGIIKSQAPEVNKEAVNSLEAENKPRTTETAINDSTEVSGADFSLADKSGNTVLTHAEESGKEATVRTPIEGANVNQVDNDGKTASSDTHLGQDGCLPARTPMITTALRLMNAVRNIFTR